MAHAFLTMPYRSLRQACAKIGYPNRQEARRELGRTAKREGLIAHGSGRIGVYRCRHCRLYHVGHQ